MKQNPGNIILIIKNVMHIREIGILGLDHHL